MHSTPTIPSLRRLGRWAAAMVALGLLAASLAPGRAGAQTTPPMPPPYLLPPYVGQLPSPGQFGLVATSREVTYFDLSTGLTRDGCAPVTIAVTVGGYWLTFVGGTPPPFVNAPTLAAMPTLAAGTGFFVRCEARTETQAAAPIESVQVVREGTGYTAVIVSGLPNGCARFDFADSTRNENLIKVQVWNRISGPGPCTMVYGMVTTRMVLPGTFVAGQSYTLMVNDVKTVVWTAGIASATAP